MERFLIFISYRRGESAGYAGRLHESLERRLGDGHVFRDVDELEPGQDFVDAISARLRDCAACLVIIGSEWLLVTDRTGHRRLEQSNDYVRLEIEAALARSDLLVVPVLVEGAAMPSAEDLPASVRALSRRHALSLRDETWDADVDRLVRTLEKRIGRSTLTGDVSPFSRLPRFSSGRLIAWSVLGVVLLAAAMFLTRGTDVPDPGTPTPGAGIVASTGVPTRGPARAIALPRLAEVAHGHLIYTVLAGDIAPSAGAGRLRLRIRVSNEGASPVNFWDSSFLLATQAQVLAPTSGLNEIVSGHAIQQGVIAFDVPAGAIGVALRVVTQGLTAEIPLDLKGADTASRVEDADPGDALSRAQVFRMIEDTVPLVEGKDLTYTLTGMVARRFVNTLRIVATVRVSNNGPYPWLFGLDAIRLLVDGRPLAPFAAPVALVPGVSSASGDFFFDVPPPTRRITLRVSDPKAEVSFDVPAASR